MLVPVCIDKRREHTLDGARVPSLESVVFQLTEEGRSRKKRVYLLNSRESSSLYFFLFHGVIVDMMKQMKLAK
jgi:hypothetical protein